MIWSKTWSRNWHEWWFSIEKRCIISRTSV